MIKPLKADPKRGLFARYRVLAISHSHEPLGEVYLTDGRELPIEIERPKTPRWGAQRIDGETYPGLFTSRRAAIKWVRAVFT